MTVYERNEKFALSHMPVRVFTEILDVLSKRHTYIRRDSSKKEDNTDSTSVVSLGEKIHSTETYDIFSCPLDQSLTLPQEYNEPRVNKEFEELMQTELKRIICACGEVIAIPETVYREPSSGWEELVSIWSCHNQEFSQFASQKIQPKTNGILYSPLYLVIKQAQMNHFPGKSGCSWKYPKDKIITCSRDCTKHRSKSEEYPKEYQILFYDTLKMNVSEESFFFYYLHQEFQEYRTIYLTVDNTLYRVSLLNVPRIIKYAKDNDQIHSLALKVSFSQTEASDTNDSLTSTLATCAFYSTRILSLLKTNQIGLSLCGASLSFVFQK
ncbi:hypothetical protein NEOKW01_0032 [Nematocida sp. AWRm80]|nr:hypothetical protein NEOKW01_0032 [Nematocida sp. AWRm80]